MLMDDALKRMLKIEEVEEGRWERPESVGTTRLKGSPDADVRWTKILHLRACIATGSYEVSSAALADCLLRRLAASR